MFDTHEAGQKHLNEPCNHKRHDKKEVEKMPRCPICGAEVDKPEKTWVLRPRNRKKGIVIGLFRCPNGHVFRAKIGEVEG